jgi:hypothetical protein
MVGAMHKRKNAEELRKSKLEGMVMTIMERADTNGDGVIEKE